MRDKTCHLPPLVTLAAALLFAAACEEAARPTTLFVEVHSDLQITGQIDTVQLAWRGRRDSEPSQQPFALARDEGGGGAAGAGPARDDGGASSEQAPTPKLLLPLEVEFYPRAGREDEAFDIDAIGTLDGAEKIRQSARVSFHKGKTRRLSLVLGRDCFGIDQCEDQNLTCFRGNCVSPDELGSRAETLPGTPPPASSDASSPPSSNGANLGVQLVSFDDGSGPRLFGPAAPAILSNASTALVKARVDGASGGRVVLLDGDVPVGRMIRYAGSSEHELLWTTGGLGEGSHTLQARLELGSTVRVSAREPVVLDRTRPVVEGRLPVPGSEAIAYGAPIEVRFSEPVDPATVTAGSLVLQVDGAEAARQLFFAEEGKAIVISPEAYPAPPAQMNVVLTSAIRDRAGNGLEVPPEAWSWRLAPSSGGGPPAADGGVLPATDGGGQPGADGGVLPSGDGGTQPVGDGGAQPGPPPGGSILRVDDSNPWLRFLAVSPAGDVAYASVKFAEALKVFRHRAGRWEAVADVLAPAPPSATGPTLSVSDDGRLHAAYVLPNSTGQPTPPVVVQVLEGAGADERWRQFPSAPNASLSTLGSSSPPPEIVTTAGRTLVSYALQNSPGAAYVASWSDNQWSTAIELPDVLAVSSLIVDGNNRSRALAIRSGDFTVRVITEKEGLSATAPIPTQSFDRWPQTALASDRASGDDGVYFAGVDVTPEGRVLRVTHLTTGVLPPVPQVLATSPEQPALVGTPAGPVVGWIEKLDESAGSAVARMARYDAGTKSWSAVSGDVRLSTTGTPHVIILRIARSNMGVHALIQEGREIGLVHLPDGGALVGP